MEPKTKGKNMTLMQCGHNEENPIPESAYCNNCLFLLGIEAEGREYENCNPRLRANYNYNKKYWQEL
jgi:hypothetical protein